MTHRLTSTRTALLAVLLLAACNGGGGSTEVQTTAAKFSVSGNNQIVHAARDQRLPQDVAVQVVKINGQTSLRIIPPSERVLNYFLPTMAYAQTGVTGIPNQVVCATVPDPKHALHAEVGCASSDALGRAYFTFHSDSLAGVSKRQIAAALSTGTTITDSVSATVLPSDPAEVSFIFPNGTDRLSVASGTQINLHTKINYVRDKFSNWIAPSGPAAVTGAGLADTTTTFVPGTALRDGTDGAAPTVPDSLGWFITPTRNPTGHSTQDVNGHYSSQLNLYLFGSGHLLAIIPIVIQ